MYLLADVKRESKQRYKTYDRILQLKQMSKVSACGLLWSPAPASPGCWVDKRRSGLPLGLAVPAAGFSLDGLLGRAARHWCPLLPPSPSPAGLAGRVSGAGPEVGKCY